MTELHNLVNKLTQPHDTPVEHRGHIINIRTDGPLLMELATAITSNLGDARGGSGRAAHTRSVLNIWASSLNTQIQHQIRRWAINAHIPRQADWTNTAALLRAWHAATLGDTHFNATPYEHTLHAWINEIEDHLIDPPNRWTLDAPCPLCGKRRTTDADGHDVDTLHVTEREPADTSHVLCRNCDAVWHGINGARQLRTLIDNHTPTGISA